jgi:hypothetical protein
MRSDADADRNEMAETSNESNSGIDKFFQAVIERRIADAEKELDSMRASIPATENARGCLKACEGLLLTAKAGDDRYLYLSKIEKTQKQLRKLRKEFAAERAKDLHTEYDKGYFRLLESFIRKLERTEQAENQLHDEKR